MSGSPGQCAALSQCPNLGDWPELDRKIKSFYCWLRQAGALILIFMIIIWGSGEHIGGNIIVAAEARAPLGPQSISVGKLSNGTNNQFVLFNRLNLNGCDVKSRLDCYRHALPIFDWR